MTEARSYIQRGLRFCKNSKAMWLEYARLEMSYIAKIHARREVLGIGSGKPEEAEQVENENIMQLPKLTAMDIHPEVEGDGVDNSVLQKLESTPAMSGAIPVAIFDAAMSQFNDAAFGYDFFNMVIEYDEIPTCRTIATHVEGIMSSSNPTSWYSQACRIQLPLICLRPSSPEFPPALRQVLQPRSQVEGKETPLQ